MEKLGVKRSGAVEGKKIFLRILALVLSLFSAGWATAAELPLAKPEEVGFSSKKLARIGKKMQADVEKGTIPGGALIIGRHGKVAYFECRGALNTEANRPMVKDGIFRIYSMSKPIAQAAAMMLVEEGKISLDDPVSKYLPKFARVKVGVEKPAKDGGKPTLELVAPERPITINDLMRHTSGIAYGFFSPGLVRESYNEPRFFRTFDRTNAQFADEIAKLPLLYQPGTTWDYGHSTDVLGRIIEIVSGRSLYQFEKERLLDPLGMKDTSFYVTDSDRQQRIAEAFKDDQIMAADPVVKEKNGAPFLYLLSDPRVKQKWESAGSGMVSTPMDYARFLQMLLNKGTLDGRRFLKPETVAMMTADQIGHDIAVNPFYLPGSGYGFGLGFAVRQKKGPHLDRGTTGDYFWYGAGGTSFWVDPKKDLFVVYMMQSPKQVLNYRGMLRKMVYDALLK